LLNWNEKGDIELDEWLIDNGFYTESGKKGERVRKAAKGEMWRVPFNTLGTYCALDCISTLQLFDLVFQPAMNKHKMYWDYHEGPFIRTIQELIDQQIRGVIVDTDRLVELQTEVESITEELAEEFFRVEEIRPYLEEWRQMQIDKVKVPKQFKKNGDVSKNYINYKNKIEKMRQDSQYLFNPGSDTQVRWLFYERMYENTKEIINYNRRDITVYRLQSPKGEILLPATESGAAPIDKNALPWLGKAGAVLAKRAKQDTSLTTFIRPYIKFSTTSDDGKMHPGWMVPQAVTGRLGGSKPNFQ